MKLSDYPDDWNTVRLTGIAHGLAMATYSSHDRSFVHLGIGYFESSLENVSLSLEDINNTIVALSYGAMLMRKKGS